MTTKKNVLLTLMFLLTTRTGIRTGHEFDCKHNA